jgi:ankyrin repeat protein
LTALLSVGCDFKQNLSVINAAQNCQAICLKLLLHAGSDANNCDDDGSSAIYFTAQIGQVECLKLLLDAGGDFNQCDNCEMSPNLIAASNGLADSLKMPLDAGGDFNKCLSLGFSPICMAAGSDYSDCLKLLLASRADPHSSWSGHSALGAACQEQHATHLLKPRYLETFLFSKDLTQPSPFCSPLSFYFLRSIFSNDSSLSATMHSFSFR